MVCGVAFREERFLPFADLLLLPDFVLVFEPGLVLEEEPPDFDAEEDLLFEDAF